MKEIWNYCCYRICEYYLFFHDYRGFGSAGIMCAIIGLNVATILIFLGVAEWSKVIYLIILGCIPAFWLFPENEYLKMKKKYQSEPQRLRRIRGWAIVAYIIGSFVFFGVVCYIKRG